MTITLQAVNELIQSLESAGELSIKEPKYLDVMRWAIRVAGERDAALNAERVWEKTMMEVCGEDGPASVASEIRSLRALRDTALTALKSQVKQLAAENTYLLNGAARELNTSWMFHKTMLGAQAALVCLAHGYQAAAREWLEGTTDEAGAEIPDDISVGELHEWFDSQMISNDGNSGFLTRAEAEEAIRKACSATDRIVAGIKADGRVEGINFAAGRLAAAFNHGFVDKPMAEVYDVVRMILTAKEDLASNPAEDGLSGEYAEKSLTEWEVELREGADK